MEEKSPVGKENFPKNKKKILIVDDDEPILHTLRRFFLREGFEVWIARNGLEAKGRLEAERPSLILTDIKMPSFSGIELIKFVHHHLKGIPIVAMTAYPHLYPEKRNGNEVEAYFLKPFDIHEMLSTIEKILGG
jgi:DNA-binding response OmpR family regulator